jgi:hypothetical protein
MLCKCIIYIIVHIGPNIEPPSPKKECKKSTKKEAITTKNNALIYQCQCIDVQIIITLRYVRIMWTLLD